MAWCGASSEMHMKYLRMVDIGAQHKSSTRKLLVHDTKVVHSYWHAREVIHSGF